MECSPQQNHLQEDTKNNQFQSELTTPIKQSLITHHSIGNRYFRYQNIRWIAISITLLLAIIFFTFDSHQSNIKSFSNSKHNQNQLNLFNSISHNLSLLGKGKCQNEQKNCLQQTESFNQIVEMMRMMTETYHLNKTEKHEQFFQGIDVIHQIKDQLNQYSSFQQKINWLKDQKISKLTKVQLKGLQHIRLTSPKVNQHLKFNFQALKYYIGFKNSYEYEGLNNMLQNDGTIWRSEGNMMTVFSGEPISPLIFNIQFPKDYLNDAQVQKILIFGLKAEETVLSVENTLLHNILGRFQIKINKQNNQDENKFILYCQSFECQEKYALILLIMRPIRLKSFQIYQIKEGIQQNI